MIDICCRKYYKPKVFLTSLVGIIEPRFPTTRGNYFWMENGPYIANMWAENFKEIIKRRNITFMNIVEFTNEQGHRIGLILDKQVPYTWLNQKLCVTGHGWGTYEMKKVIHEYLELSID